MQRHEEEFVHFVSCIQDLNTSWKILKLVRRRKKNSLGFAAFRLALIEYSKPFKESYGKVKAKHRLGIEYIPKDYLDLHNRILKARDTYLAHSDLNIRDARLYVSRHPWGNIATIIENVVNESQEFNQLDDIIDMIEKTLKRMYEARDVLEANLAPNIRTVM